MCFQCCFGQDNKHFCPAHMNERLKKEGIHRYDNASEHVRPVLSMFLFSEEDRIIQDVLSQGSKRKKTQFYHYENRFGKFGQTVVIWCFKDFCRTKRFVCDVST